MEDERRSQSYSFIGEHALERDVNSRVSSCLIFFSLTAKKKFAFAFVGREHADFLPLRHFAFTFNAHNFWAVDPLSGGGFYGVGMPLPLIDVD